MTKILGTQSTIKTMRYCYLLHHFKKNDLTISAYLDGIKHLCDSLARCGHHASLEEYQSVVLNGFSSEFDHVMSIITTSRVPFDMHEITSGLLDAEASTRLTCLISRSILQTDKGVSLEVTFDLLTYSRKSKTARSRRTDSFYHNRGRVDLVVEHGHNDRFVGKLVILHGGVIIDMMMP